MFSCIDKTELWNSFAHMKSNALGPDKIPLTFLKKIYPFKENHLIFIFNTILTTSVYPHEWKISRIVPVKKKLPNNSIENFRPISILDTLNKVFEDKLKSQVISHIESENLLSDCHFGFRTGSILLSLTEKVRENMGKRKLSTLISLDLSKAFNMVNYNVLIDKLYSQFKFGSISCRLIHSYLFKRR